MKTKLDTQEALRTAIANIWAIHEYDNENWTPDLQKAMQTIRHKLFDLTMTKVEG